MKIGLLFQPKISFWYESRHKSESRTEYGTQYGTGGWNSEAQYQNGTNFYDRGIGAKHSKRPSLLLRIICPLKLYNAIYLVLSDKSNGCKEQGHG